jgi:hypothetical protein
LFKVKTLKELFYKKRAPARRLFPEGVERLQVGEEPFQDKDQRYDQSRSLELGVEFFALGVLGPEQSQDHEE